VVPLRKTPATCHDTPPDPLRLTELGEYIMPRLTPPVLDVSIKAYRDFISTCAFLTANSPAIGVLAIPGRLEDVALVAKAAFADILNRVHDLVSDDTVGVCALDVPSDPSLSPEDDVFWGTVLVSGLFRNLFVPAVNPVSKTPFDVFTASVTAGKQLGDRGLAEAPERHLRFHTDGLIRSGRVAVPRFVVLYNLLISYRRPGDFHWIPFSCWTERNRHIAAIGLDTPYRFALSPAYFEAADGLLVNHGATEAVVPIFSHVEGVDSPAVFLNGDVIGRPDAEYDSRLISDLRASLTDNPTRFSIDQRTRRALFLNNRFGWHARDIFQEPIESSNFTRVHIRAVDSDAVLLSGHAVT